jgi:hypothetical protein
VTTDSTLAAIDGALRDYETSGDAMRWVPEAGKVICDGGQPLQLLPPVGCSTVLWGAPTLMRVPTMDVLSASQFQRAIANFAVAFEETASQFAAITAIVNHDMALAFFPGLHGQKGCRRCNPRSYSAPLAINGDAYRRRQKNRSKHLVR